MNTDTLAFTVLAWPVACGLLYAARALYRRTHTRRTR